jgi:hypothetical protein
MKLENELDDQVPHFEVKPLSIKDGLKLVVDTDENNENKNELE